MWDASSWFALVCWGWWMFDIIYLLKKKRPISSMPCPKRQARRPEHRAHLERMRRFNGQ